MKNVLIGKENDWCSVCDNPYYCCTCPNEKLLPDNGDSIKDIEEGNPIDLEELYNE